MILKFGKHKGTCISKVPRDYVEWLSKTEGLRSPLKEVIQEVLAGTYVPPATTAEKVEPYNPDIFMRVAKATKNGGTWALQDATTNVRALTICEQCKALVLDTLYDQANKL